jgi:hypothetical protein
MLRFRSNAKPHTAQHARPSAPQNDFRSAMGTRSVSRSADACISRACDCFDRPCALPVLSPQNRESTTFARLLCSVATWRCARSCPAILGLGLVL